MSDQHKSGGAEAPPGRPTAEPSSRERRQASPDSSEQSSTPSDAASVARSLIGRRFGGRSGGSDRPTAANAAGEGDEEGGASRRSEHGGPTRDADDGTGPMSLLGRSTTREATTGEPSAATAAEEGETTAKPDGDARGTDTIRTETSTTSASTNADGKSGESAAEGQAGAGKARGTKAKGVASGAGPGAVPVAPTAAAAGDGGWPDDRDGDLSGRPRKPILAGAALGGVLLIAVPLLVMAMGSKEDNDRKRTANAAADTVLEEDGSRAGAFVEKSPSPSEQPTEKEKKQEREKDSAPPKPTADSSPGKEEPQKEAEPAKTQKPYRALPPTMPMLTQRVLIKNRANGTCAALPGPGANDAPVHQLACNSRPDSNQRWNLEKKLSKAGPGGKDLFVIRNVSDNRCMDLPYYGPAGASTPVTEYPCNGTTDDNQLWWADRKADGRFWIRNYASNHMCLDSFDTSDKNRKLQIYPCAAENTNNHEWFFTKS